MKLASGTAPVPAYLRADVALGLGTDGAASNNDLDMFEAMRDGLAPAQAADDGSARGQRAAPRSRWRPSAAPGRSACEKQIGSLEPRQARRPDRRQHAPAPRQTPMYDPISHLVYVTRGDDVQTTIVHGKVLMREPEGADARRGGGRSPTRAAGRRRCARPCSSRCRTVGEAASRRAWSIAALLAAFCARSRRSPRCRSSLANGDRRLRPASSSSDFSNVVAVEELTRRTGHVPGEQRRADI